MIRPLLVLSLLASLLLVGGLGRSQEGLDTRLQEQLEQDVARYQELLEARRQEAAAIREELGRLAAQLEARVAERDQVSAELAALRAEQRDLEAAVAALETELAATAETIADLEQRLEALKLRIEQLLVGLYKQRSGRFAQVLAKAESFHDLRVKTYYLSLLADQDVALIDELDRTLEELFAAQQRQIEQLAERNARQAELADTETRLQTKRSELDAIIAELEATREGRLALEREAQQAATRLEQDLSDSETRLAEEIARLERERERLRREAAQDFIDDRRRQQLEDEAADVERRLDNLRQPLSAPGGDFVFPLDRPELLSRYGDGNRSFVALQAVEPGAAVRAVQAGDVTEVSLVSANDGYLVAIRHSAELVTVYTNLQPPTVQSGQRVGTGQVIGFLGGGTLPPPDVLQFWVQARDRSGVWGFVDPARLLGF